jgi:hypothetical protein
LGAIFFFFNGALLRAEVRALPARRAADLPLREAALRTGFFAFDLRPCLELLREFLWGFDGFLAMVVLRVGAAAWMPRRFQSSQDGGARENFKL